MRRILLICASAVVLALPAAAAGSSERAGTQHRAAGYLVVRNATTDGGVAGEPVVTLVVRGFVLGRVSQEAEVDVYHLASATGQAAPQAVGSDVSRRALRWRGLAGTEYSGSDFRFRAIGGVYRVVIRGSGVYLFAGGRGNVTLRGSAFYPARDGSYALDGRTFRSLPAHPLTRTIAPR